MPGVVGLSDLQPLVGPRPGGEDDQGRGGERAHSYPDAGSEDASQGHRTHDRAADRHQHSGIASGRKCVPPSGSLLVRKGDTFDAYPSQADAMRRANPRCA